MRLDNTVCVALINVALVTLAYMILWFMAAGRILRAEDTGQAAQMYETALSKAGPAYGVFLLWAFGLRLRHVTGVVTYLLEVVQYYA